MFNVSFRQATADDVEEMTRIAAAGKELLRERGIDQWQKGNYPAREDFERDVELGTGYVLLVNGKVAGICAVSFNGDPAYDHIEGSWLTSGTAGHAVRYAVAHQGALAPEYQGIHLTREWFQAIANLAREHGCVSVRIDTHEENIAMRRSFEGAGFRYCGVVHLHGGDCDGDPRVAYEMVL